MSDKPEGYVFGRPTLYKPEFCQMLINHMSQGLSYETFAGVVGVSKQTLYDWEKKNENFLDAKKIGQMKRNEVVEKLYIQAATGHNKKANPAMMIFWMKNCVGWQDKIESESRQTTHINLSYNLDDE